MQATLLATAELIHSGEALGGAKLTESILPLPNGGAEFTEIPNGEVWTLDSDLKLTGDPRSYPPPVAGTALYGGDINLRLTVAKKGVGRTNLQLGDTLWGPTVEREKGLNTRPNHVAVDPAGRLMFTTLVYGFEDATAGLYRMEFDGTITCVIKGVNLGNGFGFSADGKKLYFIDSMAPVVWVFDYDVESGKVTRRRVFAFVCDNLAFPEALPDALVVAANALIVTEWGLGRVSAFDFDGKLMGIVEVPTSRPTMAAMIGENYSIMLITSEKGGLLGSSVFAADLSGILQGLPSPQVAVLENDDAIFCHK